MSIKFDDKYYEDIIKQHNYNPLDFKSIDFDLFGISKNILNDKWLCHNNADIFAKNYGFGEESIITTGIGLSGIPHMGTLSQILRAIYLQKAGAKVQLVLGDLDSYNARNKSLDTVLYLAKIYKEFIIKLGFNLDKGILRQQYDHPEILSTAYLISNKLTDQDFLDSEEDLSSLYKEKNVYNGIEFPVKMAILLMVADFLHLNIKEGIRNVMIMLGLEEHLYVLLAKKLSKRLGININLSAMYSRIIKGLNGYPKMSKSIIGSGITVDMKNEDIRDLILNSNDIYITPQESVVFQLMCSVSFYSSDELKYIYNVCIINDKEWFEIKQEYTEQLIKICNIWKGCYL